MRSTAAVSILCAAACASSNPDSASLRVVLLGDESRITSLERIDPRPRLVLGDLSASPYVDVAGARMLRELHQELSAGGMDLRLAEARSGVRDILRAEGLEERVGYFGRTVSVHDVLESFFAPAEPLP